MRFFLILIFLMNSTVWAETPTAKKENLPPGQNLPTFVAAPKDVSDKAIQNRLQQILKTSGWYRDLNLEVKEGLVFLTGGFDNQKRKDWALRIIEKTEGVIGVIDNTEDEKNDRAILTPAEEEIETIVNNAKRSVPYILSGLALFIFFGTIAYFIRKFVVRLMSKRGSNGIVIDAASNLIAAGFLILGLYFALKASGLSTLAVTVLGGTGFLGIGIGLALKSTFENYSASLMISMREIFRHGEWVKIGNDEGIVHSVNTRGTTLIDFDGTTITIPNATVVNSTIRNMTRNPNMRADFLIGIDDNECILKAREVVLQVLNNLKPTVLSDPEPFVVLTQSGATIYIKGFFWFDATKVSRARILSQAIETSVRELLNSGISLPDNDREVVFKSALEISRVQKKELEPEKTNLDLPPTSAQDLQTEIHDLKDQAESTLPGEKGKDVLKN